MNQSSKDKARFYINVAKLGVLVIALPILICQACQNHRDRIAWHQRHDALVKSLTNSIFWPKGVKVE